MATPTRQELYDQIREAGTKDAFVLAEMKRLGFWKEGDPGVPEDLINREAELNKELQDLLRTQRLVKNKEAFLQDLRKKRMAESRQKQQTTRERKKQEREERAQLWADYKAIDIGYLGPDHSKGLQNKEQDSAKLQANGLPLFNSVQHLAMSMELSVGQLRFLTFSRKTSPVNHYKRFLLAKKAGGTRLISAPMPRLKKAQWWVLSNILEKLSTHDAAHGFVPNRNIVSNARPHLQEDIVINQDLKDFFPTITYQRVKGLFRSMGYSEQIATILALLCTEPEIQEVALDGRSYYSAQSPRHLPQGAPSSPAITNLICRRMDKRLEGLAKKYGYKYTRYADDITLSGSGDALQHLKKVLFGSRRIIQEENFRWHPDKLRIMHPSQRQEVTGITVNKSPSVNRKELKKFRALLFQIEQDGLKDKHWKNTRNLLSAIQGYAHFIAMVDPQKGKPYIERVKAILKKHQYKHEIKHHPKPEMATPPPLPQQAPPVPQGSNTPPKEEGGSIWKKIGKMFGD